MTVPPLTLYVHLPWCVRKCPYCDFNSHTAGDNAPKQRYIDALIADMRRESARAAGREVHSIFLGGGTPSLFAPEEIGRILDTVRAQFSLQADAEISMEANPGTVECGSPRGYREAGVTRLSIGAQSFSDAMLKRLGRIHSSDDIRRAANDAREAGFENVNIDLMHGLPEQSIELAIADLQAAVDLEPSHISWYQLTLEPNTVFFARPPANMPDDDLAYEIQSSGQALLAANRFEQYEISAYARDGRRCEHNMNYWMFGDYLAVGAGAHGKITGAKSIYRYQKPANPLQYMLAQEHDSPVFEEIELGPSDRVFDFMLNALRLSDGFAEQTFLDRTGVGLPELERAAANAVRRGLLARLPDKTWKPTELGSRFLNDLQSEFISEPV